jgi:hypothetical protein
MYCICRRRASSCRSHALRFADGRAQILRELDLLDDRAPVHQFLAEFLQFLHGPLALRFRWRCLLLLLRGCSSAGDSPFAAAGENGVGDAGEQMPSGELL